MNLLGRWLGGPWLAVVVMLAGGCASVQRDATRDVAVPVAAGPKPSVQLVLENDVSAALDHSAELATRDSGLFDVVSAAPKPTASADLTIKLGLKAQRRPVSDAETVWAMTTIALFTVYPSTCARDEYELTADVFDRAGTRLKSYDLRDSDTSMLWLFQGENCGNAPTADRVKRVATGLLQTLYRGIDRDRLLAIANTAQAAGEIRPRVYIEANRAEDIVRRVALTAPPFAQFAFDAKDTPSVGYRLRIDLAFGSSEETFVGLAAGMMSLALISPCSATEVSLKATVSDVHGTEVRRYDLSDSYRSAFDGKGCHGVDEYSRPEEVAEFVGKLFAQMERDRVFSSEPRREIVR